MRTLAIANQKGGCGKTATTHALGECLAARGLRVLLVDCDPQGTLSASCAVHDATGRSLSEVLGGTEPGEITLREAIRELSPTLSLAPADVALASSELGLFLRLGRELVLKEALSGVAADFDVCLLDCPPSLGLLVVNALVAADAVLVPTLPQEADLRGLRLFLETIAKIRRSVNRELELLGIVAVMYDPRLVHHRSALETMRAAGLPLLSVTVGRSVRVAEAVAAGRSIVTATPDNPRAAEYAQLAEEVHKWLAK